MQSVKIHAGGVTVEVTLAAFANGGLVNADAIQLPRVGEVTSDSVVSAARADKLRGVVSDAERGLMWSPADVLPERSNQVDAEKACRALRLGGFDDWRLPTIQELLTLVDYTRSEPAIDTTKFSSCQCSWYWTSTPYAASSSVCAWIVSFSYGDSHYGARRDGSYAFARAVRSVPSGQ